MELVAEPSIDVRVGVLVVVVSKQCWMNPIIDFLAEDRVPADEKEVGRVLRAASRYWLLANQKLYQKSFRRPYLQCFPLSKVDGLLTNSMRGCAVVMLGDVHWHIGP